LEQLANARLAESTVRTSSGSRGEAETQETAALAIAVKATQDVADARRQRDACTVAAPKRY